MASRYVFNPLSGNIEIAAQSGGGISNVVEDTTPQLGGNLDANGNDVNFRDNDKAIFGASGDLQIYHTGSNSYIQESGTGSLVILGYDTKMTVTGAATYLENTNSGYGAGEYGVKIRHITSSSTASEKFKTISTGISVTGNVVLTEDIFMDGAIVGVYRVQPQHNPATEIVIPVDADIASTPLELYAEGAAGIALTGGLRLNPATVTGDSAPANAIIPTTLSIAMLDVPDPSAAQFYLPDGHEGQILHLIPVSTATGDAALISLTIDNYRHINGAGTAVVESTSVSGNNFYPFSAAYTTAMATMVFASGAWQASQGQWT